MICESDQSLALLLYNCVLPYSGQVKWKSVFWGLHKFIAGDASYPEMSMSEVQFVLRELGKLVLHPLVVVSLSIPLQRREADGKKKGQQLDTEVHNSSSLNNMNKSQREFGRAHLLVLYTSLCELITTRYGVQPQLYSPHQHCWLFLRV